MQRAIPRAGQTMPMTPTHQPATTNASSSSCWAASPWAAWLPACTAACRYFDPHRRRAGLPEHVTALVERMTETEITLQLVNLDPVHEKPVIVQAALRQHSSSRSTPRHRRTNGHQSLHFAIHPAPRAAPASHKTAAPTQPTNNPYPGLTRGLGARPGGRFGGRALRWPAEGRQIS